jgi:hypothetical protein
MSANRPRTTGRVSLNHGKGAKGYMKRSIHLQEGLSLIVLAVTIIPFSSANVLADHATVSFGSGAGGGITTIGAPVMPKGKWALVLRSEYIKFDAFTDQQLEDFASQGEEVHSTDELISPSISGAVGVTDALTVSARLPYVMRSNIREGEVHMGTSEVETLGDSKGLGDLTVLGQVRVIGGAKGSLQAALVAGFKAPTGKTDVVGEGDHALEPEHQPGSGSWDIPVGIAVTQAFNKSAVDASAVFTVVNKGTDDVDLGDLFNYNLSAAYRVLGQASEIHIHETGEEHLHSGGVALDLLLELNGEWRDQESHNGDVENNSGGHALFLTPGARLKFGTGWSAFLSAGVPVSEQLNGIQHETSVRVVGGLGLTL